MKRLTLAIPILLGSAAITPSPAGPGEGQVAEQAGGGPDEKLLFYPLKGRLNAEILDRFQKDVKDWLQREPNIKWIVLGLESPGTDKGAVGPAADAARFIAGLKDVRVIASVGRDKSVGSASVLLALAANHLVM